MRCDVTFFFAIYHYLYVVPPSIEREGEIARPEVVAGRSFQVTCPASGIPRPEISWFKANKAIRENSTNYYLLDDGWTLSILNASEEDSTRFTCRAKNVAGNNEKAFDLQVLGKDIEKYIYTKPCLT
jgi:hypothetical protein